MTTLRSKTLLVPILPRHLPRPQLPHPEVRLLLAIKIPVSAGHSTPQLNHPG